MRATTTLLAHDVVLEERDCSEVVQQLAIRLPEEILSSTITNIVLPKSRSFLLKSSQSVNEAKSDPQVSVETLHNLYLAFR